MSTSSEFKVGERIVYPSHGVGEIINVEQQVIAGTDIRVYVISFPQDKMILKVPVNRATISGLRKLVSKTDLTIIYSTLQGKAKQGNRMWSRRAQEYESKINSGNIVAVAEVVRDLYKNVDSDRSYSERTIYESALNRLAGELAILENINPDEAINKLIEVLKDKLAA
ncbi:MULTISPECIES: CarD family transcriptional regulator [Rickettsieae]|jgi:CarD family transcriptional regulator|uniref:CarD family transcriptional regulator n=1 Tax=Rickettsieae TaxID=33988 RepID=UPI000B9C20DE|nr:MULTISPECIES: CarD family transcriptional regulator [unclassified Rickettsia]MDN3030979.1 CarD family transcriptional regulator [Candidatus Tisiphia sp.]OZG32285.1 CarD family transcriptional regulator [Rickettsia endosymbiont of Culicoides newsteadi]